MATIIVTAKWQQISTGTPVLIQHLTGCAIEIGTGLTEPVSGIIKSNSCCFEPTSIAQGESAWVRIKSMVTPCTATTKINLIELDAGFNKPFHSEIEHSTGTFPANTFKSIAIEIVSGTADITIDGVTKTYPEGRIIDIEVDFVNATDISIDATNGKTFILGVSNV